MPWSKARPGGSKTAAKYRDPAYLATRRRLIAQLERDGSGVCAERACTQRSRVILPGMKLHLCHDETGTQIRGLGHMQCNVSDAARRARARQESRRLKW